MHKVIETMIVNGDIQTESGKLTVFNAHPDLDSVIARQLEQFFEDYKSLVGYGIVHAEKRLYCPALKLAGTVDCMALAGTCIPWEPMHLILPCT